MAILHVITYGPVVLGAINTTTPIVTTTNVQRFVCKEMVFTPTGAGASQVTVRIGGSAFGTGGAYDVVALTNNAGTTRIPCYFVVMESTELHVDMNIAPAGVFVATFSGSLLSSS